MVISGIKRFINTTFSVQINATTHKSHFRKKNDRINIFSCIAFQLEKHGHKMGTSPKNPPKLRIL